MHTREEMLFKKYCNSLSATIYPKGKKKSKFSVQLACGFRRLLAVERFNKLPV